MDATVLDGQHRFLSSAHTVSRALTPWNRFSREQAFALSQPELPAAVRPSHRAIHRIMARRRTQGLRSVFGPRRFGRMREQDLPVFATMMCLAGSPETSHVGIPTFDAGTRFCRPVFRSTVTTLPCVQTGGSKHLQHGLLSAALS